jgi:hypothetical protein
MVAQRRVENSTGKKQLNFLEALFTNGEFL